MTINGNAAKWAAVILGLFLAFGSAVAAFVTVHWRACSNADEIGCEKAVNVEQWKVIAQQRDMLTEIRTEQKLMAQTLARIEKKLEPN